MQRHNHQPPSNIPQRPVSASSLQVGYPMAVVSRSNPNIQNNVPAAAPYTTALKSSENNSSKEQPKPQKTLAHALLPDIPLLMHGSGDVLPENVNPQSVAALAQLIEKYVASLVSAAMDAHDMFTDGEVVGGGACLGPPPFGATGGESDDDDGDDDDEMARKRQASSGQKMRKRRKKIDYWDEPLSPPGEDDDGDSTNDVDSSNDSECSDEDSDDDAPLLRLLSSSTSVNNNSDTFLSLQGFAPVDLHANERTRSHYVAAPTVMDARSFIFPICHDAVLYQRVKEVQASRRAIRRDVMDGTLMEIMKEEGLNEGRRGVVDLWDAILGSGASNEENNGDISGADKKKITDKAHEKDKMKAEDKKKGENIVGAGLVDTDVDPSWPGLNALSRGGLW